jgi:hypothetical protein
VFVACYAQFSHGGIIFPNEYVIERYLGDDVFVSVSILTSLYYKIKHILALIYSAVLYLV